MNFSDISLLVLALVAVGYRGWAGLRYGAAVEIRYLLTVLFGVLFAIHFWQSAAEKICALLNLDPRWLVAGVFILLFALGAAVAGAIVLVRAKFYQSVKRNYPDQALGLVSGLFSGLLLGACVLWLGTVLTPGRFDSDATVTRFVAWPCEVFQSIETAVGVASDNPGRTRYPVVTLADVAVGGNVGAPEGTILMRRQGVVVWK